MEATDLHEIVVRMVEDVPVCVEVLALVHAFDGYPAQWPSHPKAWLVSPREIVALVAKDHDGAVTGHVAVHRATGHPLASQWSYGWGVSIADLAVMSRLIVTPAARRQGVGERLLAAAANEAHGLGLRPVLDVAQDNAAAIRLYERAGWRRIGGLEASQQRRIAVHAYIGPLP
ncbi:GNAT family N-acetyltransferase [Actinoplanes sp. NPDC026670]|uniref:GNAT family N-acetyltransferase n=1 Tax=Actinoplanes sp. NPDC026670 TaxID=3154700 RepID=UPI0033FD68A3